jgi:hypothetical protein
VVLGVWTSGIQIINFFRIVKSEDRINGVETTPVESRMKMVNEADCESLKEKLANASKTHLDSAIKPLGSSTPTRG